MRPARPVRLDLPLLALMSSLVLVGCGGSADSRPEEAPAGQPRGLLLSSEDAARGYVYFGSLFGSLTYLIDTRTGSVVHTWRSDYAPGGSQYLLENGNLLRTAREPDVTPFSAGGQSGRLQELTWEGELVWDYLHYEAGAYMGHHDVEVLPNGNILAVAWEVKSREEARAMGYRSELTPEGGLWPEMIVELEPIRPSGARVVWEWHSWDHMIQDLEPGLAGYGELAAHPGRIDVNGNRTPPDDLSEEDVARYRRLGYVPAGEEHDPTSDLMHANAIAYNARLDQIALSLNSYSEIWIIDHSTTTEEARGSTGGRWGRGGELLYRWGNPAVYGRGGPGDRKLFNQHDVHWIPEGHPGAGNLLLFRNNLQGDGPDHSAVLELVPPVDASGGFVLRDGEAFGPEAPEWSYTAAPDPAAFHSPFISGARRLPDGNTLITQGSVGRFFEVTPEGEIVWEYWSPTSGEIRMSDGALPHPAQPFPYAVFRATKIAPDHPALRGRRLVPLDPQPAAVPLLPPFEVD